MDKLQKKSGKPSVRGFFNHLIFKKIFQRSVSDKIYPSDMQILCYTIKMIRGKMSRKLKGSGMEFII